MPSTRCARLVAAFGFLHSLAVFVSCNVLLADESDRQDVTPYASSVLADNPAAYFRFEGDGRQQLSSVIQQADASTLTGRVEGRVQLSQAGPRPAHYPAFESQNSAAAFFGERGFIRVNDPGPKSVLDFGAGDAITLEAWVKPNVLADEQQVYIVGKGRTNNADVAHENQNYALRLRGIGGSARVSFLFRNSDNRSGARDDFHRWNSDAGFVPDGFWHHVAVTYEFGEPQSIRGYVDGRQVSGSWDLGGPTDQPPVVDDDELWIGSSLGGNPGNTFNGLIDEVAIYRTALAPERLRSRYAAKLPDPREA